MSLCNTALSTECEHELQRIIALIPDADLVTLAKTEPEFLVGSFRANKTTALRARLQQLAGRSGTLSDSLRRVIARRSRVHTLTRLLTPEAISEMRQPLATLFGVPSFTLALLLDPRQELRALAEEWLQGPLPFLAIAPEDALERLREHFSTLVQALGSAPSDTATPPPTAAWQNQKEKLEQRLRDIQAENRRLKGVDDRLSRTAAQLKTSEEKLGDALKKLTVSETERRKTARELEEASAALTRESSRREERLAAAVDLALAREFHGWLAQAREVADAADAAPPRLTLLEQAEAALKKQGDVDRHSGNRARLQNQLDQLTATLSKVRNALAQALRQTPELKAAEAALTTEIRNITRLLSPDTPATALEEAVINRIHTADDNELPQLRDLPERFAPLRLLDAPALDRIRGAFQKRLATVQATDLPIDPSMEENRPKNVTQLSRALSGQCPAILLVDGHNLLFGLPSRYTPSRGTSLSEAEKRKRVTDDIVRIAAPNPSVRVWIVFDGPTRTDTQAAPNVRVTYSGGAGEHRADHVLLDNLRFFKSTAPDIPVFLISNDHDLCTNARRLGALDLGVLAFGAFFQSSGLS